MLSLTDRLRRRPEVTVRATSTGALLVDMASGNCWQLNRLGSDFLSLIDTEKTLSDVIEVLGARYDVSPDVLQRDLCRHAQELLDAALIERIDP